MEDGVLDAAKLGELLDTPVAQVPDGRERYGLQWAGKREAVRSLLTPSHGTLIPDIDKSIDFDNAQNVFIEGDNLEVLKLLQKAYNDRIKLIYIDPPYNTGNDFVYNDNFSDGLRGYLEFTGQLDDDGNLVSTDVDAGGRRHSKWLSMMYPRLVLARNLLSQDGIIAVSIDDNEVASLRGVLDEIFGQENFLNTLVWVSNLKGRQITGSGAAGTKEYIHVYARDAGQAEAFRASAKLLKSLMPSVYKGFDYGVKEDEHGPYVTKNELYNTNSAFNEATRPNLVFDIYYEPASGVVKTEVVSSDHLHEGFVKITPKKNNNGVNKYHAYRWSRAKVESETFNLEFVKSGNTYKVYTKVRDVDSTAVKDLIMDISTNDGSKDLAASGLDSKIFDYPKPVHLLQTLCAFGSEPDSVVLDFFAGSGATAAAVLATNRADGGRRRFIAVNLPEPTGVGSEAAKAGYDTVAAITRARIVAEIGRFNDEVGGAAGLRVFALDRSNFSSADTPEDGSMFSLKENTLRSADADVWSIAAEIFLKEGVALDEAWIEHEIGEVVVEVSGGVAVIVGSKLDEAAIQGVLDLNPRVVVFLEDDLAGKDALKANALTNARNRGITMKTV
jgi:adenine-specific DNA-methyltransferase